MWNSTFKNQNYKGLKRSGFKQKIGKPMRKTKLRVVGDNDTATRKQEIQDKVRFIVCYRDGGCILRDLRHCGGEAHIEKTLEGEYKIISKSVIQGEHLISRANSATFADTRLIVCICRNCHGWKEFNKDEYDDLVKSVISKERVVLWEKCEADRRAHKTYKMDWEMELIALNKELSFYENN